MEIKTISDIAAKYMNGTATQQELDVLHRWYDTHENEEEQIVVTEDPETLESLRARMLARLLEEINEEQNPATAMVRNMKSGHKWYWAAAATAVGLMAGGYFYFNQPTVPASTLAREVRFKNNLPAGGNHAVLHLADGRSILLDSAGKGILAMQGATRIVKNEDGQLTYQSGAAGNEMLYNSISTPVGGEYAVVLPDGSKVWLNAASLLRFPANFSGNTRNIELSGEAYFEIAKNESKPFIVGIGKKGTTGYHEIEVLGTHFNIKAYDDETMVRTTLLEGKVKVRIPFNGKEQVMQPGQQVSVKPDGNVQLQANTDTEVVMAWHNGLFRFRDVSIEEIMQQAQRWYDIDVKYEVDLNEHFVSAIPRQSTLQEFLTVLEKTGRVKFNIEGKTVTVIPFK